MKYILTKNTIKATASKHKKSYHSVHRQLNNLSCWKGHLSGSHFQESRMSPPGQESNIRG